MQCRVRCGTDDTIGRQPLRALKPADRCTGGRSEDSVNLNGEISIAQELLDPTHVPPCHGARSMFQDARAGGGISRWLLGRGTACVDGGGPPLPYGLPFKSRDTPQQFLFHTAELIDFGAKRLLFLLSLPQVFFEFVLRIPRILQHAVQLFDLRM